MSMEDKKKTAEKVICSLVLASMCISSRSVTLARPGRLDLKSTQCFYAVFR